MSYIHIKLDKFVAGNKKRIFKSSIKTFEDDIVLLNNKKEIAYLNIIDNTSSGLNLVFYGDYHTNINLKLKLFLGNLLHFNKILQKYIKLIDKINCRLYLNISNFYNCMFENNLENVNLQVNYFKSIMLMPIDIAGVLDMAYALSPFGKRKNILIVNPQVNLDLYDYDIRADYKDNYKDMYKYLFNRTTSNPLFNTIPLYSINLLHLDTITFENKDKLNEFIEEYNLKNQIEKIFCNIHNKFGNDEIDSIKINEFFEYIILNNYNIDKKLIKKLVDNIDLTSFNNYFTISGNISKLSNKTIYKIHNSLLLSSLMPNYELVFINLLDEMYTKNTIPNNSLYLLETYNLLSKQKENEKHTAIINFVNLKNFQTPLLDFLLEVPLKEEYIIDFNKDVNKLFDEDKTKSLLFNNPENPEIDYSTYTNYIYENIVPTKKAILLILSSAISYLNEDYKDDYNRIYLDKINKNTLEKDKEDYLKPFYLLHRLNNKTLLIGLLNGIRNYLNIGILDLQDNIWLSYKYITNKNETLINLFSDIYELQFKGYDINRIENHMLYDYLGIMYKGEYELRLVKEKKAICPYIRYNRSLSSILKSGCDKIKNCNYSLLCKGYCAFPIYGKYFDQFNNNIPYLTWNYNLYYLQSGTDIGGDIFNTKNLEWNYFKLDTLCDSVLIANTDIEVSDDIEIYFSNMKFNEFNSYIKNNQHMLDSIFEGFSKEYSILNNNNIEKKNNKFLYNNFVISKDTPFNGPHVIKAGTKLSGLKIYKKDNGTFSILKITEIKRLLFFDLDTNKQKNLLIYCYIRVINWWSNNIKCNGKIKIEYLAEDVIKRKSYQELCDIINNYDHLLKVDGFFKALQGEYKKSNIYSIKIKNSNFSKNLDLNIADLQEYLLIRNYAYLDEKIQNLYKFMTHELLLLSDTNTLSNNLFEFTILYKIYQCNLSDSGFNIVKDFEDMYNLDKIEGRLTPENISMSKMYLYIKNQGGLYKLDKEYTKKLIKAKNDLREIFELAIKQSVHKYMPVHTDLWKIVYEN